MALIRSRVEDYLRSDGQCDLDAAMQDVRRAMQWNDDGYRIAESLERDGWHADAELVELMDSLADEKWDALDELESEWVKAHGISAPLAIGAIVVISGANVHSKQRGKRGEIVRIDEERGKYTVMCASEGHVRTGLGTHGFVLNYEDRRACADH
jgi:hypothetical protein